jgi:hypothetical protein
MNILININDFQTENIFFMENKENIIVNGIFVKILYSCEYYTMNGIYLHFPMMYYEKNLTYFNHSSSFQNVQREKNVLFFDIEKNFDLISQFSKLETTILQFYVKNKNIKNKNIVKNISTQLKNGAIRYYNYKFSNGLHICKTNESLLQKNITKLCNNECVSQIKHGLKKFYIKISGIWETNTDIGITYKLIYY